MNEEKKWVPLHLRRKRKYVKKSPHWNKSGSEDLIKEANKLVYGGKYAKSYETVGRSLAAIVKKFGYKKTKEAFKKFERIERKRIALENQIKRLYDNV